MGVYSIQSDSRSTLQPCFFFSFHIQFARLHLVPSFFVFLVFFSVIFSHNSSLSYPSDQVTQLTIHESTHLVFYLFSSFLFYLASFFPSSFFPFFFCFYLHLLYSLLLFA